MPHSKNLVKQIKIKLLEIEIFKIVKKIQSVCVCVGEGGGAVVSLIINFTFDFLTFTSIFYTLSKKWKGGVQLYYYSV